MLTILTKTNALKFIRPAIASVERLDELVEIQTKEKEVRVSDKILYVTEDIISSSLDWHDTEPPYIMPEIPFSESNLLAMVFYKLGNHQKAFEYINEDDELHNHLLIATYLQFGYEINEKMFAFAQAYFKHNSCIIQQYGRLEKPKDFNALKSLYADAIANASNDEFRLFTIKHFVNLLIDNNSIAEAEKILRLSMPKAISEEAKNAMNSLLATVLMAQLKLPYNPKDLNEIQELQLASISFYEEKGLKVNAGLVLIDASEIANFQNNFIESKNLINKAILYFKEENVPEFLGEAGLRKATLLYTWSKNGSPQYYKPAINAFQDALKVFKRDTHPKKFADIHHNLALIYSEIPVSNNEKPIWAAFCASSFKEALAFYTKEQYPYEYAMLCHNYATALMNFPEAKLNNNLDKAFKLFEEALEIRTDEQYPFERALTLLNQLELYWLMHNEDLEKEKENYNQMIIKANAVIALVKDASIIERAQQHIQQLEELKSILN